MVETFDRSVLEEILAAFVATRTHRMWLQCLQVDVDRPWQAVGDIDYSEVFLLQKILVTGQIL
jgi:hypothetical protein